MHHLKILGVHLNKCQIPGQTNDTMFLGTFTPAEAHWLECPQIVARQFGINLTDEDLQNMSMKERHN